MTNRLNELKGEFPKTKKAFDNFINSMASHKTVISDFAVSEAINKLNKKLEEDLKKEY